MRIRLEEATAQFAPGVSFALVRRQQTNNRGRPGFHGGTQLNLFVSAGFAYKSIAEVLLAGLV